MNCPFFRRYRANFGHLPNGGVGASFGQKSPVCALGGYRAGFSVWGLYLATARSERTVAASVGPSRLASRPATAQFDFPPAAISGAQAPMTWPGCGFSKRCRKRFWGVQKTAQKRSTAKRRINPVQDFFGQKGRVGFFEGTAQSLIKGHHPR